MFMIKKTGRTIRYENYGDAADKAKVSKMTIFRALVSGLEVKDRLTFSLSSNIEVQPVTHPNAGNPYKLV